MPEEGRLVSGSPQDILAVTAALTRRERKLIAASRGEIMEASDQIGALVEAAGALAAADIAYALIGGLAVGIRAEVPRATMDVDLAVPTSVGREHVAEVLQAAGFHLRGEFPHSLNFRAGSGEPVQVAFDPDFDAAIARAERVRVGELHVPVVRKDDLIRMKQRAAEDPSRRQSKALRDRADIELLCGDVGDADEGW